MMAADARLLAVHSGALGDVVLFCHLLGALRTGGERIALAAGGEKARLMHTLGAIDEALDFDALPMHELFADSPADEAALSARLGTCDRLVSCFATGDVNAQRRLAAAVGAGRGDFLPIRPASDDPRHLLDLWAQQLGLPKLPPSPRWPVPPSVHAEAIEVLRRAGIDAASPFVAVHVGSGSPDKCWPAKAFSALAKRVEFPVLFLLGPVERERVGKMDVQELTDCGTVLSEPTLEQLAGILAAATAFVGNDSGPAHLGGALGTPTLVLFGPTDPNQFAPRGERVRTIHHVPLAELTIDRVAGALAGMLRPGPREVGSSSTLT